MTGPQRVLITGGASGIGRAMADAFREDGALVHVADVDGTADLPPGEGFTVADVSDPDEVDRLFDDVVTGFGGLDVLCANVGIAGPTGPVEELEASDWDRTMAVNVRSAFLCCRRSVPLLRKAGGGSILLTASTAGITGAVVGLGKTLAMEVGELGIRVNVICPGSVDGERIDRVIAAESTATGVPEVNLRAGYEKQVSMRTFVEGRDIGAMAVFLASPAARFVNGQTISVDGGLETLRNSWRT